MIFFRLMLLLVCCTDITVADIRILPEQLELNSREARHQLLIANFDADTLISQVDDSVSLTSTNPQVARIEGNVVIPVTDGETTIEARQNNQVIATTSVRVVGTNEQFRWTFRNHVQSVLARQGCNMGACHGALAGKGGFRLSLRGYDTERDYYNITTQQFGRRVDRPKPQLSLLLTKPTQAVPHKGGLRLPQGSLHYRVLAEWIAAGAPGPQPDDARLNHLQILPSTSRLKKGTQQPLIVRAHYSDGRIEDVTHWAKFTSANEAVATVNEHGTVSIIGPGEGAVTAWFGSQIVIARLTSPFEQSVPVEAYTSANRRNFIDDLVLKQLQQLKLKPATRCSDSVFIRRAFLDTIGTLPTSAEVRTFLADDSSNKRDKLIESLFQRPEFADYWTYQWSDLLMLNGQLLRPDAIKSYYTWIHQQVEDNTPWDEFVRQIVTARGSSIKNGATNFFAIHQTPEDMAENVSQAFMGLSIGCAKCHNHPLEKWTNDQYYAFANLFARVRAKGWGGDARNGNGRRTLITVSTGELIQPRTGKPQPPTPLDAQPLDANSAEDRREYLADWLVSPDNKLFARSITNRIWRNFMGVGLVEDVDDMRASNPASNEALLAALSDSFVKNDFNLQYLMKQILQSETYQRSSTPDELNAGDQRHYSRYFPRRLMAEVMLDALSKVTAVPTKFDQIQLAGSSTKKTTFYADGTRAIQLYDSAVKSYFLQTFGRHQRRITCECERSDEPSLVQVLHINNGKTVNEKLRAKNNQLEKWLTEYADDPEGMLNEIFLSSLARHPAPHELTTMQKLLSDAAESQRREIVEDIVWSLFSSREFLFNH